MTKHSVWESVAVTEREMISLIASLQNNGIIEIPFTGEEIMRLFAYRRMIKLGLFNEGVKP